MPGRPSWRCRPRIFSGPLKKTARTASIFLTVHCGVTRESVRRLETQGRVLGIVSRGGSILAHWMDYNDRENPLYEQYDRLLEIAKRYDMVLSLGDGLRPGCLADATDRGQVQELILLGELTLRARERGVQVMIEGPGHVPLRDIQANILLEKSLCNGAPFYVLGPLPTDIAPGYDHITAAIGGALAGWAGADYLCYVTPSEHLRLPTIDDVREGVIASKIAAHIADSRQGYPRGDRAGSPHGPVPKGTRLGRPDPLRLNRPCPLEGLAGKEQKRRGGGLHDVRGSMRRQAWEEKKSREGLIPFIKLKSPSFPLWKPQSLFSLSLEGRGSG